MNVMDLEEWIRGDTVAVEAFKFFLRFARFEFALKEEGFRRSDHHGVVLPDWTMFVARHEDAYIPCESARALLRYPPRVQRISDGGYLNWEELSLERVTSQLGAVVLVVKTIRNNLFHGGKFSRDGGWDDPPRMRFLLDNGTATLHDLARVGGVEAHYYNEY